MCSMAPAELFNRLKFEDSAFRDKDIKKILVVKCLEDDVDWDFELHFRHTSCQESFVNLLIKKTTDFVVDFESMSHDLISNLAEVRLRNALNRDGCRDWHV